MLKICRSVSNGLLKPFVGRFLENLLNRKEDNHPSAYKADTNPWRALPPFNVKIGLLANGGERFCTHPAYLLTRHLLLT